VGNETKRVEILGPNDLDIGTLQTDLTAMLADAYGVELVIQQTDDRPFDPTVLVALISGGAIAIGYLIRGLLEVAKARTQQKVILKGADFTIEIPADIPDGKLDEYIHKIRDANGVRFIVL
jgi:hypothetical protein